MVGDGTRTIIVQEISKKIFKKYQVQRTLNSAEAVAQGCSLTAAMILPHFHVQNFLIEECNQESVDVTWSISGNKTKTKTLFPLSNNFPSIKSMTFDQRAEPIDIAVSYHEKNEILEGIPTMLSRYRIEIPTPEHKKFALKLRVKLDQNCIPGLDTAELIEEYKEEKKVVVKTIPPMAKTEPKKPESKDDKEKKDEDKKEKKDEEKKETEAPTPPPVPEQKFEIKIVDKTRTT